ncbi:hypothetical protein EYF80_063308 [Liparis tanakae]|uniref:Uncharacterized protein n=1 Tax=Liparis tanakae TaxID=230148 RepID=A0A4Z2ECH3_9TELE|nr:hypothetical protein EYF80_063308 [Liparis tanakae]
MWRRREDTGGEELRKEKLRREEMERDDSVLAIIEGPGTQGIVRDRGGELGLEQLTPPHPSGEAILPGDGEGVMAGERVALPLPLPVASLSPPLRRSKRATAGVHSNPHRLPRSAIGQPREKGVAPVGVAQLQQTCLEVLRQVFSGFVEGLGSVDAESEGNNRRQWDTD